MSKSKPFHGTITLIISAWLLGFFCRGHELQKNIRQHLQPFPPLQRLSCVGCRALRKKHLLSVCLVYYSFISSHSQALQSSFMNLAALTFSFMTWNCPFFIFTQRTCYYTYIWITVYKDTFLLCIFITVLSVQISAGWNWVCPAGKVSPDRWMRNVFLSCWCLLGAVSEVTWQTQKPETPTHNTSEHSHNHMALFIQNYWYPCQPENSKILPHNPKRTQGGKGWSQPMMYGRSERFTGDKTPICFI